MEDFKLAKSQLRNKQTQELKVLEKELKKKKGSLREAFEEKIEQAKQQHQKELHELAKKCGVEQAQPSTPVVGETKLTTTSVQSYYFVERNWSSLGKKELETECQKRGLGKGGNREELVTKLILFHNDQKRKVEAGEINPTNLPPEPKKKGQKAVDVSDEEEVTAVKLDPARFLKKAGASPNNSDSSDESSDDYSSSGQSDDELGTSKDIADSDKVRGSIKEDLRGTQRREAAISRDKRGGRGKRRGGGGRNSGRQANTNVPEELSPEERQKKRERVMQQVLIKMLEKSRNGVLISDLEKELKKLKVSNFRPELLGYDSMEEWIENQPSQVLFYDAKEKTIFTSRIHGLPEEEEE